MLEKKAAQIRLDTLQATYRAGMGHIGECMSVVEILTTLYYGELTGGPVLSFDSGKPGWDGRDYVILSKGSAVPVQYTVLADLGFFDKAELDCLGQRSSLLKKRPNGKVPGITASMLSDGYGLSVALGLALSLRMERKNNRVFAVLGNSELQKGQVWEAAAVASHYNFDNLIAFVDNAAVEIDLSAPSLMRVTQIQDKFESFGWEVIQVMNGHDFDQLLNALSRAFKTGRKPVCLWCHTVAGKGVEFAERKPGYLKARLSEGEMSNVIPKLQELI